MSWKAKPTATEKNPRPARRSTGFTDGNVIVIAINTTAPSNSQLANFDITVAKLSECRRRKLRRNTRRRPRASSQPTAMITSATPMRGRASTKPSSNESALSDSSSVTSPLSWASVWARV